MRFAISIVCFFSFLGSSFAESKDIAPYSNQTIYFNYPLEGEILSFNDLSFCFSITTSKGIAGINSLQQVFFPFQKFDSVQFFELQSIMGNIFVSKQAKITDKSKTVFKSGNSSYFLNYDSLFIKSNKSNIFVCASISNLYKVKNRVYVWTKSGSLFELNHSKIHKVYSSTIKNIQAPLKIVASSQGLILIFSYPAGILTIKNSKPEWILPLTVNKTFISAVIFDARLYILQSNGLINRLYISKKSFTIDLFSKYENNKPLAFTVDVSNRLAVLYKDKIEFFEKKPHFVKTQSDIKYVYKTINGYISINNNGLLETHIKGFDQKYIKGIERVFQLWESDSATLNIIHENGLYCDDNKRITHLYISKLIASTFKTIYGNLWIYYNNAYQFVSVNRSKFHVLQQIENKNIIPVKVETDKVGNLWVVTNDSIYFYSARSQQWKPVCAVLSTDSLLFYKVSNYLLLTKNNKLYKCDFYGKLIPLTIIGDLFVTPYTSRLFLQEGKRDEFYLSTAVKNGEKFHYNVFKIKLVENNITTTLVGSCMGMAYLEDVYLKYPIITFYTGSNSIQFNITKWQAKYSTINFYNTDNQTNIGIEGLSKTKNAYPSSTYFQFNLFDRFEKGKYQVKFEPQDTVWRDFGLNQIYPFPKLNVGVYKLHVRYCTLDGIVRAQSTLLLNIDDYEWFKRKYYVYYFIIFILFSLLFIHLFYRVKIYYKLKLEEYVSQRTSIINEEKHKFQKLLEAFVPREATNEIIATGKASYRRFDGVSVLFADIQGFSIIAENTDPEVLIEQLDDLFYRFDFIVGKYGIEKIKTIGDAYMCAGGLPLKRSASAVEMILAAMEMLNYVKHLTIRLNFDWKIRVGIHTGKVIAGVIGQKKLSYDIWGDTVNVANRIESSSLAERINISGETYKLVKDFFDCEYRGRIPIKNRGEIDMYFVNGIHNWLTDNRKPNAEFNILLQLLCLNDLAEVVLAKIDEEMPANRYYHTSAYIHHVYESSKEEGRNLGLTAENQLVLQTACLLIYVGMIEHYEKYIDESCNFARTILPEYNYNTSQIELICTIMQVAKSLNPNNLIGVVFLELIYSCWGTCNFPDQLRALYIEESEVLERLSWRDWVTLKIVHFEHILRFIDINRANFEVDPSIQIQNIRATKL